MDSNPNKTYQGSENYSVDEMMAHLKRNDRQKQRHHNDDPSKQGELITREDGSQVVKVRRRKRRSQQPEKKKNTTSPRLKWAILGTITSIFIILIAGTVFIIAKYNGRKFKETTESTISNLTKSQSTTLTQLRVTPISAKASKAELTWNQHAFFDHATFNNIRADIKATSFFSSDWIGEEVVANAGKIHLQTPSSHTKSAASPTPSPYRFGTFRCAELDLHFGKEHNAPAITGLQNVALSKHSSGIYQIAFQNGTLDIANWPNLNIFSGIAVLRAHHTEIEALLKGHDDYGGELTIKGRVSKDTSRPVTLDVKARDYPVEQLLGSGLGRMVRGYIRSDMGALSYNYTKPTSEALSFVMPFHSTELVISELPLFTDLKDLTRDTQYIRPSFNDCRGTIMRTQEAVTLSNLHLFSSGVITLKGNISVNSRSNLSGELQVGIPARLFSKRNPPPSIFSEPHNGNIFVTVKLSGSIHNPHDNLNELLQSGNPTPNPQPLPSSNPTATRPIDKEKEFEELTR